MSEPRTVDLRLLPKQARFIQSRAREVMLSGGYGSGKSIALCLAVAMRATVPNSHELLLRKWNVNLTRSTLRTLLDGDGQTPPILPAGSYTHHKSEQRITLHGGGAITYLGCDDLQKLGSLNATGASVDEAAELSADDYTMIRGRVRVQVEGLIPQIFVATNPQGPEHFLAKRFGLDGVSDPAPNTEAILSCTADNRHLPDEYVDDLSRLTGADRARLFEGKWVKAEGLVYPAFDPAIMVRAREGVDWSSVIVGQDCGFNDPDVLLVVCRDGDGRIHVAAEWCDKGQTFDAVIEAAQGFAHRFGVARFMVDPSAARLRDAMQRVGLNVCKAENPVLDGIRTVQRFMVTDGAGVSRFTVDPSCGNLIRSLQSYAWHPKRPDVPLHAHSDPCDALRYACMELDGRGEPWVVNVFGDDSATSATKRHLRAGYSMHDDDDDPSWQEFSLPRF